MLRVLVRGSASAEQLWSEVADVLSWPDFVPTFTRVEHLEGGPDAEVGASYRVRQPGLAPAVYQVTQWEPGRSFTWTSRTPLITTTAGHAVRTFGDGSELELTLEWRGVLAPLVRPLLARRAQRMMQQEADALIERAESHVTGT